MNDICGNINCKMLIIIIFADLWNDKLDKLTKHHSDTSCTYTSVIVNI
jgi:hypothetical protein